MENKQGNDLGEELPEHFQKNKIAYVELKKTFYITKNGQLRLKNKEKEYASKHYQENKEYYLKKRREWRKNNLERIREIEKKKCKKYREENKEKIRQYKKKYYLKNRERILEKVKFYDCVVRPQKCQKI